jgi:hypothetical protein
VMIGDDVSEVFITILHSQVFEVGKFAN